MSQTYLNSTKTCLKKQLFLKTVLLNPYIKQKPTTKQAQALLLDNREILYGGAAGPGKSSWLLMRGLQYVDVPRYSAIIFRKSFTDLSKAGALIDRSHEWLDSTDARWDGINHIWTFPSTAKLSFGALENDRDVYHHQSAEYQFIGFDELTQFTEFQYRYMHSRLRRLEDSSLPLQICGASNPLGIGHDWVKRRYLIEGIENQRAFVPGRMTDNPYLDQKQYLESLNNLDPITREAYLNGNWSVRYGATIFKREKLTIIKEPPASFTQVVRYWDMAATKPNPDKQNDPDYTVGALWAELNGQYYCLNIQRLREVPQQVEARIKQTAQLDHQRFGNKCKIFMEQEPGSSGVSQVDYYARQILNSYPFWPVKTTGAKAERAAPFSSAVEAGNVFLVEAVWNSDFIDECEAFPLTAHDDQVDASSGAFEQIRVKFTPWVKNLEW